MRLSDVLPKGALRHHAAEQPPYESDRGRMGPRALFPQTVSGKGQTNEAVQYQVLATYAHKGPSSAVQRGDRATWRPTLKLSSLGHTAHTLVMGLHLAYSAAL